MAWRFASEVARRANNRKQFDLATSSLADALSKGGNFKPAIVQPLWNRFELEFRESSKIIPEATAARLVAVYGALNLDFADLGARAQKIANHDESRMSAVQAAFRKETAAKFPNSPKSLAALETGFSTKAAKETGASPSPAAAPQFQP